MNSNLHHNGIHSITSWLLPAAIGIVVSGVALTSMIYGSAARQAAERIRADQTARENRVLCGRLGMVEPAAELAACMDVLLEARRLEAKQVANDIGGIL